ncbi:MAG: Endo,4-beta-xylanase precursor [Verrucomicrobiota bacterium]
MSRFAGRWVGALALGMAGVVSATEFHVSQGGSDGNVGTAEARLRTIGEAAKRAQPGDTITVHAGVYRERVNPPRGGTSETQRIVYQAAPGELAVIKGSNAVTRWTRVKNDTWLATLPNKGFGGFNPFGDLVRGDWFVSNGRSHHTGAVYLNGQWLTESAGKAAVLNATGATPLWFAEVDGASPGPLMNLSLLRPLPGPTDGAAIAATRYTSQYGVQLAASSEGEKTLTCLDSYDWVRYEDFNFGTNANQFAFRVASGSGGGRIELRLDSRDGPLLGSGSVASTGGWQTWQTVTADITPTSGLHTLCLVFKPTLVGTDSTRIWAQFKGVNPNAASVEVNVRQSVFYPDKPGINFITVRGFTMEQAATPWAPPTAEQIGVIGPHWSKGWIIENNNIRYATCSGVSLGKYGDEYDNTSADTDTGYVETVNRALAIGWNQEHIGSHVVRNNDVSHCEQAGIVGSLGVAFSTITGNNVHDIHVRKLFSGHEMAGIKFHGAIDTVIGGNHIFRCHRGMWLDWMTQGTRITNNLFHDCSDHDLWLEVNHGPFLVDHNLFLSAVSIQDWSEGGTYAHNLFAGRMSVSLPQDRVTPFHQAHSTAIAGASSVTGGDDRFYNNLFVNAGAGLVGYNAPGRPMQMNGNVFVNGAASSSQDVNLVNNSGFNPALKLSATPSGYLLHIALDPEWANSPSRSLVTTALLGCAAVSKLPYEQADTSAYQLDSDYLGVARNPSNPFPGPFELPAGGSFDLKVSATAGPATTQVVKDPLVKDPVVNDQLVIDPLVNGDFEQYDVPAGVADDLTGWTRSPGTLTVETTSVPSYANTQGAASQVGVIFVDSSVSAGYSWFWQPVVGISSGGIGHNPLTASEIAGQLMAVSARVGVLAISSGPPTHGLVDIGFQNQGSWEYLAKTVLYTGTQAQATAAGVTADVYLGLDGTNAKGASTVWSGSFTIARGLPNSGIPLAFSVNFRCAHAGDITRAVLDDITLSLPAKPRPAKPLPAKPLRTKPLRASGGQRVLSGGVASLI